MNNEILLSIVITTHGEKYDIRNFYEISQYSIFSHFNEPIEIIISEDYLNKEPEYVKELEGKGLNIKYSFSKERGLANNRTNGLMCAKGKYVTFVDAPDTLDFDLKSINEIISSGEDVITFITDNVTNDFFTTPTIWGKLFKTDLLKKAGGFYFGWTGWWEEGTSQAVIRYNTKDLKVTHKAIKSDKIIYTWINDSEHTVGHFPTKEEIRNFLEKSKRDFYPDKKEIYMGHLEFIIKMIDINHDRFSYDYTDIKNFCLLEQKNNS